MSRLRSEAAPSAKHLDRYLVDNLVLDLEDSVLSRSLTCKRKYLVTGVNSRLILLLASGVFLPLSQVALHSVEGTWAEAATWYPLGLEMETLVNERA